MYEMKVYILYSRKYSNEKFPSVCLHDSVFICEILIILCDSENTPEYLYSLSYLLGYPPETLVCNTTTSTHGRSYSDRI